MPDWLRPRLPFVALALATIALGLGVHLRGSALAPAVRDVLGDALWAAMVFWWVSTLAPRIGRPVRVFTALAICFAIETSQRFHPRLLDELRGTRAGHLVLGSDFDPRDLAAYTLGVLGAVALESAARRRRSRGPLSST